MNFTGNTKTLIFKEMFLFSWLMLWGPAGVVLYYMATIVRALWLVAKQALFACNDQALFARWTSRHLCYCQLTAVKKGIGTGQIKNKIDLREVFEPARLSNPHKHFVFTETAGHKTSLDRCYFVPTSSLRWRFFSVIRSPVVGFNWSQALLLPLFYISAEKAM